jgi:hypothetical protein
MRSVVRSAAFAALLIPALARADDDPPTGKKYSGVDAKTAEVMKKLGKLYKDAKAWRVEATIDSTVQPEDGEKRQEKYSAVIDVERPNRFAFRTQRVGEGDSGHHMVSDGKTMTVFDKKRKQYAEMAAPAKLGGYMQPLARMGDGGLRTGILFLNILQDDPDEALLEGVTKGEYVGIEKVDGRDAHRLKFKQERMDWELWVAADGQPFVLKMADTSERPDGSKVTLSETYKNWKVNAEPAKDTFTFTPPEGATKAKLGPARKDG